MPELQKGQKTLEINGSEHHHIINVFRKRTGDKILLTNGKGLLAKCEITEITKRLTKLRICSIMEEKISQPTITVAFPLLKNKNDHLIIEKLTELGVKEFFPITSERSVRKASQNTITKFEKTAISAIKQCDNAFLPKIHQVQSLPELIKELQKKEIIPLVSLEFGENNILEDEDVDICLIIGPEGGFEQSEAEFLKENNAKFFTLGNHILRAETAAITAVSQMLALRLAKDKMYY